RCWSASRRLCRRARPREGVHDRRLASPKPRPAEEKRMTRVLRDLIWQQDDAPAHNRRLTRAAVYTLLVIVVLILGLNSPIMSAGVSQIGPVWMGVFRVAGAMV